MVSMMNPLVSLWGASATPTMSNSNPKLITAAVAIPISVAVVHMQQQIGTPVASSSSCGAAYRSSPASAPADDLRSASSLSCSAVAALVGVAGADPTPVEDEECVEVVMASTGWDTEFDASAGGNPLNTTLPLTYKNFAQVVKDGQTFDGLQKGHCPWNGGGHS